MATDDSLDPVRAVVVPARPGPIRPLAAMQRRRDEVDDVLDDLFGTPDDRGPGVADAVLVAGGASTVVVAQLASWPAPVTALGVAAAGLGLILPVRSLWRRAAVRRRTRQAAAVVGDGMIMRNDDELLQRVLAAHDRIGRHAGGGPRGERARDVAHGAALEVATLLEGRRPTTPAEREYVAARAAALEELVTALTDPTLPPPEDAARSAMVEARREVEAITGTSAVTEAADLVRDLRDGRG